MTPEDKTTLDAILAKDAASLTEAEIAVLRARESYLNADQREKFASVLNKASDAPKAPAPAAGTVPSKAETPLEDLSDKELKKLAKSRDLKPEDFDGRDQLIAAIREKQAPAQQ